MSLSGSSASRKSIWAITRFARSSSMKVGRKMIRSFNRREKMSNARSPRGVCSITIGTRAIGFSLSQARLDRKSTRLNSSHTVISYAVFCLKKKKKKENMYENVTFNEHQLESVVQV